MCQRETGNSFMVPRIHRTNPNQCQLSCWDQKTHRLNSEINLWVDDGTPCSYDAPHGPMCIQGEFIASFKHSTKVCIKASALLLVAQKRLDRVPIIKVTSAASVPLTRATVAMMMDVNMLVDLIRKSKITSYS